MTKAGVLAAGIGLLACACGVALGYTLGASASDGAGLPMPPGGGGGGETARLAAEQPSRSEHGEATRQTATPSDVAAREAPPELIPGQLRAYADAELQRGWRSVREDEMPPAQVDAAMAAFEKAVLAMPFALGEEAARAQVERDKVAAALASGDGVQLLASLVEGDADATELVRDPTRFAAMFVPRGGGSAVSGSGHMHRIDDQLADGSTLVFGAGVFELRDLMRHKPEFPSDVTVRGAGMDATLLVLNELYTNGPLRRFAIEHCTVYVNSYLTDLRREPAVMAFRGVRFVGFDIGAGASVCFGVDRAAILASDCRFEGGYGTNPDYCNLIRANGPSLCRFERCVFSRLDLRYLDQLQGTFVQCTMSEMLSRPQPTPLMAFDGCRIDVLPSEQARDREWLRRDLNDLFPQWKEQLAR